MRKRWIVVIVGLLSVMLLAVGCQAAETPTPTPGVSLKGRFQVESPGEPVPDEEPVVVTWGGYTRGHRIGATSPFTVSLENVSDEREDVRVCLTLLDSEGVVAELAQQRHELAPRMTLQTQVQAEFPDDLGEGTYGLTMVVRDSMGADAGVVMVGVGEDTSAGATVDIPSDVVDGAVAACPPVD